VNELSLFTGAGGGLLASHRLGWTTVGYVEFEDYPQRVLRQRIRDGILPLAPIYGDIKTFIKEGYAEAHKGLVDIISAGFPCQPFSVAGKGEAENDPRNMWPPTIECIRIIRPLYAELENVSGLLSAGQAFALVALEKIRQLDLFGAGDCKPGGGRFVRFVLKVMGLRYFGRVLGDLAEAGYDARWCVLGADDAGANHRRKRLWIWAWRRE